MNIFVLVTLKVWFNFNKRFISIDQTFIQLVKKLNKRFITNDLKNPGDFFVWITVPVWHSTMYDKIPLFKLWSASPSDLSIIIQWVPHKGDT